ncbi:MAG: chorismate mutase [Candidatus Eisenbacteria bacterium]
MTAEEPGGTKDSGAKDTGTQGQGSGTSKDVPQSGPSGGALDRLRSDIDGIDQQLVDLLSERLRIALEIGKAKVRAGHSFFDPVRERRVLDKVRALAGHRYPPERIESIYREIISASRTAQAGEMVLVHGAPGSPTHEAAHLRFGTGPRFDWTPNDAEVFGRLADGSCDYAVVSLEGRSLEVSVERLDLFLHSSAQVFAEVAVRPTLSVFAPPGVVPDVVQGSAEPSGGRSADLTAGSTVGAPASRVPLPDAQVPRSVPIFGTPANLARASGFLSTRTEAPVEVAATLGDAIRAAESRDGMVLGPPVVGVTFGWPEVLSGVQDESVGKRRFFVLATRSAPPSGRDRTLLLLVLANRSGALHGVTEVLVESGLNLSWMEPKSSHLGSWDHLFLFEIDGHREDPAVARAVERLAGRTEVMRVLGSYPREFA